MVPFGLIDFVSWGEQNGVITVSEVELELSNSLKSGFVLNRAFNLQFTVELFVQYFTHHMGALHSQVTDIEKPVTLWIGHGEPNQILMRRKILIQFQKLF